MPLAWMCSLRPDARPAGLMSHLKKGGDKVANLMKIRSVCMFVLVVGLVGQLAPLPASPQRGFRGGQGETLL